MTQTELRERIANGEHSGVEFTSDVIEKRRLAEELVAFANLRGGHVLLGVDDSGSVLGLTKIDSSAGTDNEDDGKRGYQHLEEWVMQACRDKIRPEIVPCFRPELRPVSGTSIADLDRRRLEDYFGQVRQQHAPASTPSDDWRRETAAWARNEDGARWRSLVDLREQEWWAAREAEWSSLLVNTELLDDGARRPATVAGLLLFGSNPSRYLPQARIGSRSCRPAAWRMESRRRACAAAAGAPATSC